MRASLPVYMGFFATVYSNAATITTSCSCFFDHPDRKGTPTSLDTATADVTSFNTLRMRSFCLLPRSKLPHPRSAGLQRQRAQTKYRCAYIKEILGRKSMPCRRSSRMGERGIEGNIGKNIGGMGLTGNLLGIKLKYHNCTSSIRRIEHH